MKHSINYYQSFEANRERNQKVQDILNAIRTNEVLELVPMEGQTFNELYTMNQQDGRGIHVWQR
jgi:hypothetical protein